MLQPFDVPGYPRGVERLAWWSTGVTFGSVYSHGCTGWCKDVVVEELNHQSAIEGMCLYSRWELFNE